jgi:hypothetical protein
MTTTADFPALNGQPVTERVARICRLRGHATHTVNGCASGTCPRCGDVTEAASYPRAGVVERQGYGYLRFRATLDRNDRDASVGPWVESPARARRILDHALEGGCSHSLLCEGSVDLLAATRPVPYRETESHLYGD